MVSDAEDNNSRPLLLVLWWHCSFTALKCTLRTNAFLLIFPLPNIIGSLSHALLVSFLSLVCVSAALSWAWFWFSLPPFLEAAPGALGLTFAHYLGRPHRTLSTLAFGLLWLSLSDENKDQSRDRGGTAHRQVSLTIYLHCTSPWCEIWRGLVEASATRHCTITTLTTSLASYAGTPLHRKGVWELSVTCWKEPPVVPWLPRHAMHGCSKLGDPWVGEWFPDQGEQPVVVHSPCNKIVKALLYSWIRVHVCVVIQDQKK